MSLFKSFWQDRDADRDDTASSLIPLPTVSTLLERPRSSESPSGRPPRATAGPSYDPSDPMLTLQRAETALQRQLQDFLDAQSKALFPDLEATPTNTVRAKGRRQPVDAISLSDARNGLGRAMLSLSDIKSKQSEVNQKRAKDIRAAITKLDEWNAKETSLRAEITSVKESSQDEEVRRLNDESNALQDQVNAMEAQLSELRSQQRIVKQKLSEKRNAVNSSVASLEQSLSLVDSQRQAFLARPPRDLFRSVPDSAFIGLKPNRRSPQLAADALKEAQNTTAQSEPATRTEEEALDEGVGIWEETVRQVVRMEQMIKTEMKQLSSPTGQDDAAEKSMKRLLDQLETTIKALEGQVADAEHKGRSLLVCCIGAELEALQNGQQMLRRSLEASKRAPPTTDAAAGRGSLLGTVESVNSPPESNAAESPVREFRGRLPLGIGSTGNTTDESDGDPESLLVAHHDTDTD